MAGWGGGGGGGGGGGWGGAGGMGWNPGAMAGIGGNLMGGMGNIGKALGIAGRMRPPGMAEGGQPGGTALAAALGPVTSAHERARSDQALDALRARDRMQQAQQRWSPVHVQMPPEMQDVGAEAPMGEWPYNRTGVTPFDPIGMRSHVTPDSPEFHHDMDLFLSSMFPIGSIAGAMAGRPMERPDIAREMSQGTREGQERHEHEKEHKKSEYHRRGGRTKVRYTEVRAHRRRVGGAVGKALAAAKRKRA